MRIVYVRILHVYFMYAQIIKLVKYMQSQITHTYIQHSIQLQRIRRLKAPLAIADCRYLDGVGWDEMMRWDRMRWDVMGGWIEWMECGSINGQ